MAVAPGGVFRRERPLPEGLPGAKPAGARLRAPRCSSHLANSLPLHAGFSSLKEEKNPSLTIAPVGSGADAAKAQTRTGEGLGGAPLVQPEKVPWMNP